MISEREGPSSQTLEAQAGVRLGSGATGCRGLADRHLTPVLAFVGKCQAFSGSEQGRGGEVVGGQRKGDCQLGSDGDTPLHTSPGLLVRQSKF